MVVGSGFLDVITLSRLPDQKDLAHGINKGCWPCVADVEEGAMRVGYRLLIADDDKNLHNMLSHALSTEGFDIIHSYDGRETLKLAKEQVPDLIVLDILMPFVDGRDVCMELKSDPSTEDIKVLMMTGKADQLDRMLGLEIGADDYIAKPFSGAQLCRKIKRVLENE